uniref:Uncharacterized protein n=1 Tax=Anguilla anguilla TaxID=7936 RepID=A0A0E9TZQ4_ANGAN
MISAPLVIRARQVSILLVLLL